MIIPSPDAIKIELARRSLQNYIKLLWPSYETAKHIDLLCEKLEAVERGEIRRLIICEPPRCSKSVHVSEYFPPWCLGKKPSRQIITSCYSGDFAAGWGGKVKEHIEDPLSKKVFPDLQLKKSTKSKTHFETTMRGEYSAVGVGGAATGRGADILIVDDPIKNRQDAESETIRETIKGWYRSTAYTRLMPDAAIIIMMTRWHIDDLVGWLLKENTEDWELLVLPAIAEGNDLLGRKEGDALWPEKYPIERLEEIRATLGSYEFNALYQQRPAPLEGGMFKLNHFNRYSIAPEFPEAIIHSYDTGTKTGADNDPTTCGVWQAYQHGYYQTEVTRDRISHPERKRLVINMWKRDRPLAILIEDEGNGTSLIQDLQSDQECREMNIIPIPTKGRSKEVRAISVTGLIESGIVYLPQNDFWLADFEHELRHFPNVEHDDQIDQMTQALSWMRENRIGIANTGFQSYNDDDVRPAGQM
jgi:predicted phage terminase large subunit-like protein